MPARLRKTHQDDVREKIRTSQLLNRLTDHALSDEPILDGTQVRAIDIMLKKVLPDLTAIEGNLNVNVTLAERFKVAMDRIGK